MNLVRRCIAMAVFLAAILLGRNRVWGATFPRRVFSQSPSPTRPRIHRGRVHGERWRLASPPTAASRGSRRSSRTGGLWAVGSSTDGSSATASADYFDDGDRTTNSGGAWTSSTPVFGGVLGFGGISSHQRRRLPQSADALLWVSRMGTANKVTSRLSRARRAASWTKDFFPLYLLDWPMARRFRPTPL